MTAGQACLKVSERTGLTHRLVWPKQIHRLDDTDPHEKKGYPCMSPACTRTWYNYCTVVPSKVRKYFRTCTTYTCTIKYSTFFFYLTVLEGNILYEGTKVVL